LQAQGLTMGPEAGLPTTVNQTTSVQNRVDSREELDTAEPFLAPAARALEEGALRRFRKVGDIWIVQFESKATSVKNMIGLVYIAHLLRSPGRSFSCKQLVVADRRNPRQQPILDQEDGTELHPTGSLQEETIDEAARKAYKDRLESIEGELREAQQNND